MRNRLVIGALALLLASAFAGAQDKPQGGGASSGTVELGGRFTSTDGDEARYERYQDLRNGANVNFLYHKETSRWTLDLGAKNIGYRDGRYQLKFSSQRVKLNASFDQTPLNYGYYTRTPFVCTAGNCALDSGLRAQVQAGKAVGVPAAAGQLKDGSAYNPIARQFDLSSRRDTIAADLRVSATDNLDFLLGFNSYKRSGNMPYGAAFAFNNAVELPIVIDNRETDLSVGVEWASHQGMFSINYQHAKFDQQIPSFTFDNPRMATDFCQTGVRNQPEGVCYDPSGYSNGNGPAFGRMALPPSNTLNTFSWAGMVKLPAQTTANASFMAGASLQDEALIPWTTNTSIANADVYALFPELAELRQTAGRRLNYTSGTMNVRSKPHRYVTLTGRYRFNGRHDFTREFEGTEYVRFDAVPEETGGPTHSLNINRNTMDVNLGLTAIPRSTLRVGYGFDKWEHTHRTTVGWKDNTMRASFDTVGNQWLTLRAVFEHTQRDVVDLSIEDLEAVGMQPAARFYDEAARTRKRGTFVVELTPVAALGINLSLATGKDDYKGADDSQLFGLLNNKNTGYTVGVSYAPNERVNVGADYGRETFESLQESRNANPAPDPSWTDPARNWTLANDETVDSLSLYLNLLKTLPKTDIRASYDYSASDQGFVHGGARIAALTFIALPNVKEAWHRASVDVRYSLTEKVGLGVTYAYEKLDVEDFATINSAGPQTLPLPALGPQTDTARIDWLGSITTGYAARPYKGSTAYVRLFYRF